jgi:hypothetical protein
MLLLLGPVLAQEEEVQEMPKVEQGHVPEGRVYIRPGSRLQVEEVYRGGQLMLQVRPAKGRPYYLVDTDGDGNFDSVQWVLISW